MDTAGVEKLGTELYNALTASDQAPMTRGEKTALHVGCTMLATALDALVRIADAMERQTPDRPSKDALHGL